MKKIFILGMFILLVLTGCMSSGSQIGGGSNLDQSVLEKAKDGKVVLFFSAKWCSTCQALKSNLAESQDEIPADLTIVEIDYDNSADLKQRYGVLLQHTLVQIDGKGDEITQWNGSTTLKHLLAQLK